MRARYRQSGVNKFTSRRLSDAGGKHVSKIGNQGIRRFRSDALPVRTVLQGETGIGVAIYVVTDGFCITRKYKTDEFRPE